MCVGGVCVVCIGVGVCAGIYVYNHKWWCLWTHVQIKWLSLESHDNKSITLFDTNA